MTQLSLKIVPRLPYSPANFVLHAGIEENYSNLKNVLSAREFSISYITAGKRSGKTHFSIKICDELMSQNFLPRIFEGDEFTSWIENRGDWKPSQSEVIVVDDADVYFDKISSGDSGQFVGLFEELRHSRSQIILISSKDRAQFKFDEHIQSRLNSAHLFDIKSPAVEDMQELIKQMALQRGLSLKDSKLSFIARRLRREIIAIEDYLSKVEHLSSVLNKSVKMPLLNDAL